MNKYYDTNISDTVIQQNSRKRYRISVRGGVPYITYARKTRVLFCNPVGGAYINIKGYRIYFV